MKGYCGDISPENGDPGAMECRRTCVGVGTCPDTPPASSGKGTDPPPVPTPCSLNSSFVVTGLLNLLRRLTNLRTLLRPSS